MTPDRSTRWLALALLCLGDLMIVLDITVVNVALPTIRGDLGFSEAGLAWVVNAYMVTFGGFLLLGGRLGDIFGPRSMFLVGVGLFALASLACGLATSQAALVAARAVQGCGGAVVSAVALSLIVTLFQEPGERAKAMGVFGFVSAGGGSIGVLLGGVLTQLASWHWVFLVNVPIGAAVMLASWRLLAADERPATRAPLDVAGACTVTLAMLLAVTAIVGGNEAGWLSARTLGLLAASVALALAFLAIEARVAAPLVPLALLRLGGLARANVIGMLWSASMFAAFFLSGLYLQLVLRYSPLQVGLAFLPTNILMAAFSLGLSARIVMRWGNRGPIVAGLAMVAVGLALLARAPVDADFVVDVLPGFVLQGLGAGVALNPLLMAAMGEVGPEDAGLASGLVNTAFMLGGALGLAILASLAAARTAASAFELDAVHALNAGYHAAFLVGAGFATVAALVGLGIARAARISDLQPGWRTSEAWTRSARDEAGSAQEITACPVFLLRVCMAARTSILHAGSRIARDAALRAFARAGTALTMGGRYHEPGRSSIGPWRRHSATPIHFLDATGHRFRSSHGRPPVGRPPIRRSAAPASLPCCERRVNSTGPARSSRTR